MDNNGIEKHKEIIDKMSVLCAKYFKIEERDLYSKKYGRTECLAKHMLWYLLHTEYGVPTSELSRSFFRTRRHVFFGINKIKEGMKNQKFYIDIYNNFVKYIDEKGR